MPLKRLHRPLEARDGLGQAAGRRRERTGGRRQLGRPPGFVGLFCRFGLRSGSAERCRTRFAMTGQTPLSCWEKPSER